MKTAWSIKLSIALSSTGKAEKDVYRVTPVDSTVLEEFRLLM
jgi:hypothetical protein